MNMSTSKCAHGIEFAKERECIDCEIQWHRDRLNDHLDRAESCARKLAELAARKRSET